MQNLQGDIASLISMLRQKTANSSTTARPRPCIGMPFSSACPISTCVSACNSKQTVLQHCASMRKFFSTVLSAILLSVGSCSQACQLRREKATLVVQPAESTSELKTAQRRIAGAQKAASASDDHHVKAKQNQAKAITQSKNDGNNN